MNKETHPLLYVLKFSGLGMFSGNSKLIIESLIYSNLVIIGFCSYFLGFDAYRKLMYIAIPLASMLSIFKKQNLTSASYIAKLAIIFFISFLPSVLYGLYNNSSTNYYIISTLKVPIVIFFTILLILNSWTTRTPAEIFETFKKIVLIQIPLCLYQFFVIAPQRGGLFVGDVPWDAVVGSFGGHPLGGGNSPTLALFMLSMISVFLYQAKIKEISRLKAILWVALAIFPIFLAEVKIALFLLPLIAFASLLFAGKIKSIDIIIAVSSIAASFAIFSFYSSNQYAGRSVDGIDTSFENIFIEINDSNIFNKETGELGRISSLHIWNEDSTFTYEKFFGHGAGSVRYESFGGAEHIAVGSVSSRYPYLLTPSLLVALLWENGLIFTLILILSLAVFCFVLFKNIFNKNSGWKSCKILFFFIVFINLIYFAHTNAMADAIQTTILFCIGLSGGMYYLSKSAEPTS